MPGSPPLDVEALHRCVAPFPDGRTLPARAYTSPEVFAWDAEHLYEESWTCVGRSEDLTRPGDQRAVTVGSEAVLLARGQDGILRAFFDTCRHRGHELLPPGDESLNRSVIRCPYHAWTYTLDGAFKTAPGFVRQPGFDQADPEHGLVPARAAEWGGWMFVDCSGGAPDISEHAGNLADALRDYEPERLRQGARVDYDVRANWKVIAENYHECYHCDNIHPELCRVTPTDSGDQFVPTGVVIGGWMDLMENVETMSLTGTSLGVPFRNLDERRRREVHYYHLMPNLLIAPHPDYVVMHRLEPRSADMTRVECRWLFPPEAWDRSDFDPGYAVEFWDLVNRQDWSVCEGVQRGAGGRGYRQGPLSDGEIGVHQFVALVAQSYLGGRLTGPVPSATRERAADTTS